MSSEPQSSTLWKIAYWAGWVVTCLVVAGLTFSGSIKLIQPAGFAEQIAPIEWPVKLMFALGCVEIGCAVLYFVPWTAVLGAILVTGYAGGAVATHVRLEQPFVAPIILGVLAWVGLFLRDRRIRQLLPIWF